MICCHASPCQICPENRRRRPAPRLGYTPALPWRYGQPPQVTHIIIGRHPDRSAVGAQLNIRIMSTRAIERRLSRSRQFTLLHPGFGIVAIHDDDNDRAGARRRR